VAEETKPKRFVSEKTPEEPAPRRIPQIEIRHLEKMLTVDEARAILSGPKLLKKVIEDEKDE